MKNSFNFSSKACVLRKSYGGDIYVTVAIELPRGNLKYVLYVLADNDYCLQVYLPNKFLDKTIRKWIAAQTVEEEPEIKLDNLTEPF